MPSSRHNTRPLSAVRLGAWRRGSDRSLAGIGCAAAVIGALSIVSAGRVAAQTTFPVTLQSSCSGGMTTYTHTALRATPTSPRIPDADFGATTLPACDADVLFEHGVFWRLSGDPGLSQFYDAGTAADQGGITMTSNATSYRVRWPDVDNRGVLDATWDVDVACCGPSCGRLQNVWTLHNPSAAPVSLEFVAYVDFDYSVLGRNDLAPGSAGARHIVRENPGVSPSCAGLAEFSGTNISHWEVNAWPIIELRLTNGMAFTQLNDTGLPFTDSDYTGAMQWNLTIAAGQSATVRYRLGHNALDCGTQTPGVQSYGAASGPLTLTTLDQPVVGCPVRIRSTGPAGASATLLVGAAANVPVPSCPQTLLINPLLASVNGAFDANGDFALDLPATGTPQFCGLSVSFQAFALVIGPACLPLQHSDGLTLTFGGL